MKRIDYKKERDVLCARAAMLNRLIGFFYTGWVMTRKSKQASAIDGG